MPNCGFFRKLFVGPLLPIGRPEALQHRVVPGVEGLECRFLGISSSSQDGVCKADAVRLSVIPLVEPASLRDLRTYGNNTEDGDGLIHIEMLLEKPYDSLILMMKCRIE